VTSGGLRAAAQAWLADDPDERDQAELRGLLAAGTSAAAELADRFGGRLPGCAPQSGPGPTG